MQSLDEVLSARAQGLFKNKLAEVLDPETWTAANRESKMAQTREISEAVAVEAVNFVKELLDVELDGKPLLWWKVMEQFVGAEVEMLMGFRDELDSTPDSEINNFPVTYEWLTANIRTRLTELTEISMKVTKAASNEGTVEPI